MPAEKTMASTCPPSWTRKAPKYLLSRCRYTCNIQMTVQMSIYSMQHHGRPDFGVQVAHLQTACRVHSYVLPSCDLKVRCDIGLTAVNSDSLARLEQYLRTSSAVCALSSPRSAACSTARTSACPHMPRKPLFLFMSASASCALRPPFCIMYSTTAGSMSPQRLPITSLRGDRQESEQGCKHCCCIEVQLPKETEL